MPKVNNRILFQKLNGELIEKQNIEGLTIEFHGSNNLVEIQEGSIFQNCRFILKESSKIIISKTQKRGIRNVIINMNGSNNSFFSLDKDCSIESAIFMMTNEPNCSIKIGSDCLISSHIVFRANDGHTIYDINTNKIINHPEPINIGSHVWIGASVTIMKGVKIPNNSIVGIGSIITKKFSQEYTILAGIPGRVVKENVNWDRRHIKDFKNKIK